jgi:geranylgeranyl pyrophosphate synthase
MRPVLTLIAAEAVTRDPAAVDLAEPAACAIELIHTYSLIHDDLPAMDNDTLRRGRPTSHVVFGEGLAILAGDGLLTEAFALLAREPRQGPVDLDRRKVRTIDVIATAAGAAGMVGGQAIDLAAAGQVRPVDPDAAAFGAAGLEDMHARKTGALIRASATAGAIMAGGDDSQVAALACYGTSLGLAFQIVDDILDVEGAAEDLGKTTGKDAAAGKPTYPALHGLEGARRRALQARDDAIDALQQAGLARADGLIALARRAVERTR